MSSPNLAALELLSMSTAEVRDLLKLPEAARDKSFQVQFVGRGEDGQMSPDTQESSEAATLDESRNRAAYRTWKQLTEKERQEIQDLVKRQGSDPEYLLEEMKLQS